jgi:alpha-galactosidase
LAPYAHPGAWNDPDMLEVGNGGMTDSEYRTHFGLWAEMAAPLLVGTDLRKATPQTMAIYLNKDVIAVDQDPLGVQGRVISTDGTHLVFAKPLANGDVSVALLNEGDTAATISTTAADAGLGKPHGAYTLKDLWSKKISETAGRITAAVPAHGTAMYRVSGSGDWSTHAPATAVSASIAPAYPGGPVIAEAGKPTTVTTTFTNTGRTPVTDLAVTLDAPAGWTVVPTSDATDNEVGTDRSLTTTWTVTPPDGTAPGKYVLTPTAKYLWDDGTQSDSTSATSDVLVPNAPPTGTPYVSDLQWTSSSNGWGPVERDRSNGETGANDGKPITIGGQVYAKGLGAHAPSEVDVYLGGRCASFSADVGLDDEVGNNGSVVYQVWADGTKVADSGTVKGTDAPLPLSADLGAAKFVRLVITDAGNGNTYDHADWGAAQLNCT